MSGQILTVSESVESRWWRVLNNQWVSAVSHSSSVSICICCDTKLLHFLIFFPLFPLCFPVFPEFRGRVKSTIRLLWSLITSVTASLWELCCLPSLSSWDSGNSCLSVHISTSLSTYLSKCCNFLVQSLILKGAHIRIKSLNNNVWICISTMFNSHF